MRAAYFDRLCRAIHSDVTRLADHRYRVSRADHSHTVDLTAPAGLECGCEDYAFRGGQPCLHILAAQLAEGDRDTIRALRALVAYPGALRVIRSAAA